MDGVFASRDSAVRAVTVIRCDAVAFRVDVDCKYIQSDEKVKSLVPFLEIDHLFYR